MKVTEKAQEITTIRSHEPAPNFTQRVMSTLRLDPLSGKWVAMTASRAERPHAFLTRTPVPGDDCPFCANSSVFSPPPIETRAGGSLGPITLLPNLYPAFEGKGALQGASLGPMFLEAPATGSHEVMVFSTDHQASLADLSSARISEVLGFLRDRFVQHEDEPSYRYTQAIVNHGREAGASVQHPHAQLLAIPFVPREILDEQAGFARFEGNCLLCATIEAEEWARIRLVLSTNHTIVICPFWSGNPYEMLILPRSHEPHFATAGNAELASIAKALHESLTALRAHNGDVAYNMVLHTAPFRSDCEFHWHIHLYPKMTTRAGFEMGTGVPINIVAPETAATALRSSLPE